MINNLLYKEIEEYVTRWGYTLIDKNSIKDEDNLRLICSNGCIFNTSYKDFKKNCKCPICGKMERYYVKPINYEENKTKGTNGEQCVEEVLIKYNIKYYKQYRFEDCKDENTLPFDFYLPEYNICVEYDGRQHFEPIKSWGGDKKFEYIVKHDKIKNDFCKYNGIGLIRISCYEEKLEGIEQVLIEKLLNIFKF